MLEADTRCIDNETSLRWLLAHRNRLLRMLKNGLSRTKIYLPAFAKIIRIRRKVSSAHYDPLSQFSSSVGFLI